MTLAEITVFAQLLNNDNLHPQTVDLINEELCLMIGRYAAPQPAPEQRENNPYDKSVFDEWITDPLLGPASQFKQG